MVSRIAGLQRDVRFIYIMRNPIERIESHYAFDQTGEAARDDLRPLRLGVDDRAVQISSYAMQLRPFYDAFPRSHILLVAFEELRDAPAQLLQRICAFLGIDDQFPFTGLGEVHYQTKGKRLRSHPLLSWGRGTGLLYRMWSGLVPFTVRDFVQRQILTSRKSVRLSAAQRRDVLRLLSQDLEVLRTEFGFDTSRWRLTD